MEQLGGSRLAVFRGAPRKLAHRKERASILGSVTDASMCSARAVVSGWGQGECVNVGEVDDVVLEARESAMLGTL